MAHILIVESRFYDDIADALTKGAVAELKRGGHSFEIMTVPGAFEVPAAIRFALESGAYDGFVALGCVIRGETTHYDYVCAESARGLMELSLQHQAAIGNGILTVENREQAMARAGGKKCDKGADAVQACLRMIALKTKFKVATR
ncbi:MAG: 6,7-dimethyl-8-ribityllumazine synthase [Alphaproteobacteria bacterium]|nr:6,7-dimethyl-8-ribityllumazine synthase [Alphaproteobacteria bacterium]